MTFIESPTAPLKHLAFRSSQNTIESIARGTKLQIIYLTTTSISNRRSPLNLSWMIKEETDPSRLPTKKNMRTALHWLVQGCQPGDSLLFHYSGHGSQIKNNNGDEFDGRDEALCPLDFETQGKIVDDEINRTIVNLLPRGAKLHAIIDACHSGTALDLPFLCRMNNDGTHKWDDHRPRSGVWKGTNGGSAILFSGCDDDQYSHELPKNTSAALLDRTITGVMTVSFIRAIEELGVGATYGSILTSTRNTIPLTNADAVKSFLKEGSLGDRVYNKLMTERSSLGDAINSVLVSMLQEYGSSAGSRSVGRLDRDQSRQDEIYIQEPQLTSNHRFDIHTNRFFL